MAKQKLFLRSKDVAHLLGCSPDDVYQLVRKGELPAIKKGKFWLFRHEDVMGFMKKQEAKLATR